MIEIDTLTLVRWRLNEGRTIADSDVHELVAQIDQLKDELSEAVERGNDWCDQAKKARTERDRLREALQVLIANMHMHPVVQTAALDIASTALKETGR
jgi:uncharacterized coiled-coil DUF342 family protein